MILTKIDNNKYLLKIFNTTFDIYNTDEIETFTRNTIQKILKHNNLEGIIHFEVYIDENYGTIIEISNLKNLFKENEIDVKITFNLNTPFLYLMDYFDIIENNYHNQNIYYYQNNFYLELTNKLNKKQYYNLLELSQVIYEDTFKIKTEAIKL